MSEISIQGLLTVRDSPHAAESCLLHARASHSDCADACLVRCLSHVQPQCWSRCLGSKPLPCSRRGCLRKGKGAQAVIQAAPISRSWSHDGAEADCGDLPGSSEGTSGISAMRCHKGSGAACFGHDAESAVLVFPLVWTLMAELGNVDNAPQR